MHIVVIDSVTEYAARVAGALVGASSAFPVLQPPASRVPSPADSAGPVGSRSTTAPATLPWISGGAAEVMRWYALTRSGAADARTGPVLGFGDADWALPAMLHASSSGRPFTWYDDPGALVAAAARSIGPVTVCAPPHLLPPRVQDDLTRALSFAIPHDGVSTVAFPARALSYLTARTLAVLTRSVAAHHRRSRGRGRTALGLFPERLAGVGGDDTITCLVGDDLNAAAVRAVPDPDLLMMWGHSREDLFHLGRDALCGRSFDAVDVPADSMVPTCAHAGSCIKQGEILPVNHVAAGALVMGGCNIMRWGATGLFAPEFSLAFSALEGGASVVVAPAGVVIGSPIEFLFLYRLLRGGLAIGEAVRLLNAALPFVGPDSPSYVVLGEGDRVLFDTLGESAHVRRQESNGEVRVEFRDVDAEYLVVRVPQFATDLQVRLSDDSPQRLPLYFTVVPQDDGQAAVFLFGRRRMQGLDVTVSISTRPPGAEAAAAVHAAMTNLQAYGRLLRGYQGKLRNLEPEWRSSVTYLVRNRSRARYDLRACADTDRRARATDDAIHQLDRSLCRHYLERTASAQGFTFHEQCLFEDGTFTATGHFVTGPCPYCGDEMMGRTIRSTPVVEIRREVGICRTCGTIWDRPEQATAPTICIDPVLRPGVPQPVVLELHNPLDRRVRGWAGLTVRRAQQFGYVVEPAMHELILEPGEKGTAAFQLATTTSVPTDAEFLRGFWSSELAVTIAQRTIWTASRPLPARRPVSDRLHPGLDRS